MLFRSTFPSFAQRYLPSYTRPHVGRIENLPVAIVISQKKPGKNVRSTVGTFTDTYTLLRLLFSRVGKPFVGYSDAFSFNHPEGRCKRCDGLGEITEIDVHRLVDFDDSLILCGVIVCTGAGWRRRRQCLSRVVEEEKIGRASCRERVSSPV